ncbi:MAG: hypothetical protein ACR2FG_03125, partial [Marmoricola sp.]
ATRSLLTSRHAGGRSGYSPAMASQTQATTDHDEIRRWVEKHDGSPASVKGTESADAAGVLRIDFPGGAGEDSTFFKLVNR